jgi:hypothetical protein
LQSENHIGHESLERTTEAARRIYAALKNGWPVAKLTYSDYCAFSAQQRYYDHAVWVHET